MEKVNHVCTMTAYFANSDDSEGQKSCEGVVRFYNGLYSCEKHAKILKLLANPQKP